MQTHLWRLFTVHDIPKVTQQSYENIPTKRQAHETIRDRLNTCHARFTSQQRLLPEEVRSKELIDQAGATRSVLIHSSFAFLDNVKQISRIILHESKGQSVKLRFIKMIWRLREFIT